MSDPKMNLRLKSSFAGTIYEHIKELICSGELKPNQRITVQEFAKYFNVSITPVREAFQRLLAEKYLSSNKSNRNELSVINLTPEEVNDIYELYRALDPWGLKQNLGRIPDKVVMELSDIHETLRISYEKRDLKSFFRKNFDFHALIWKACHNDFVYQIMVDAQSKISIFVGMFPERFYSPEVLTRSFNDHCEMIEAIRVKDMARLEIVLDRHWQKDFFKESHL
jgi:DNA-binding GntR family transcriptional regulator